MLRLSWSSHLILGLSCHGPHVSALISLMLSQQVDNNHTRYVWLHQMCLSLVDLKELDGIWTCRVFKSCDRLMYIILLLRCGGAVRAEEVLPVEIFVCNVRRSLLSDGLVLLRSPPVLLQIQPARQMDAGKKHTFGTSMLLSHSIECMCVDPTKNYTTLQTRTWEKVGRESEGTKIGRYVIILFVVV